MAIYKLRDIIKLNDKYIKKDVIYYLELSGIDNFEVKILNKKDIPSRAKWNIDKNTIIIGRVRPFNKNHNYYNKTQCLVGSSGFTCFKSNNENINNKYLWYVLKKEEFLKYTIDNAKGSTYPEISQNDLLNFSYDFPILKQQQEIIDIIKPIEMAIINIQKQILEVKKLLKSNYQLLKNEQIKFTSIINLATNKYNNQKYYLATNAIGECTIDESKAQDVSISRASRANLTPEIESIIFSKLDGENKVLYIGDDFKYVISTGFFNVETSYLDHVMGFLLSEDFKKQKSLLSTGTTMAGLNNSSLEKIMISRPNNNSKDLVNFLNELISIENSLKDELQKCISLLIK